MAFLLGSFTNGLFGGARDVMDIATDWEKLKQTRLDTQLRQRLADKAGPLGQAAANADFPQDQGAAGARAALSGPDNIRQITGDAKTVAKTFTDDDLNSLPNLASSEMGLGPRILAALNPTAGSTV